MLNNIYLFMCSLGVVISAILMSWTYLNQRSHNIIDQLYRMVELFLVYINSISEEFGLPNKEAKAFEITKANKTKCSIIKCEDKRHVNITGQQLIKKYVGYYTNLNEIRSYKEKKFEVKPSPFTVKELVNIENERFMAFSMVSSVFRSRFFELAGKVNNMIEFIENSKLKRKEKNNLLKYLNFSIPVYLKFAFFIFYYYENKAIWGNIVNRKEFDILVKGQFDNIFNAKEELTEIYKVIRMRKKSY